MNRYLVVLDGEPWFFFQSRHRLPAGYVPKFRVVFQ